MICDSLTEIVIPGNVQVIDENAFSNCLNIRKVIVMNGCKIIKQYAFENCHSLKEVILSKSTIADEDAFPTSTKIIYRD